jgi:hypothetical protein
MRRVCLAWTRNDRKSNESRSGNVTADPAGLLGKHPAIFLLRSFQVAKFGEPCTPPKRLLVFELDTFARLPASLDF